LRAVLFFDAGLDFAKLLVQRSGAARPASFLVIKRGFDPPAQRIVSPARTVQEGSTPSERSFLRMADNPPFATVAGSRGNGERNYYLIQTRLET